MVGLVPKVLERQKDAPTAIVGRLDAIIEHLRARVGETPLLARRVPVLLSRWSGVLPAEVIPSALQVVLEIISNARDVLVRYEGCAFLRIVLPRLGQGAGVDFGALLEGVVPLVLQILEEFLSPQVLWPLINLLTTLLEAAQSTASPKLLELLSTPAFDRLLKTDSVLLRSTLVEMFRTLLVAFSPDADRRSITFIVLNFIDSVLDKKVADAAIVRLWHLLVREYRPNSDMDKAIGQLFEKHFEWLLAQDDESMSSAIMLLLEEHILLDIVSLSLLDDILTIIDRKYHPVLKLPNRDENDSLVEMRASATTLAATLILLYLNKEGSDNLLGRFAKFFQIIVTELLSPLPQQPNKALVGLKTTHVTLFNRFLIASPTDVFTALGELGVDVNSFWAAWFGMMPLLVSRQVSRINTVALLHALPFVPAEIFRGNFGGILHQVLPDVLGAREVHTAPPRPATVAERLNDGRLGERKEALRKTQLYEDFDLPALLRSKLSEVCIKLGIDMDALRTLVEDQREWEALMSLLSI
eukprot:TRINITY_DN4890_c0_g2_i1.p1 TRINITY_DN4890_c0_g2~~TRINITY_DN4890_c0_g2_i1.p1  ORF type:complete len:527 (+),score=95.73 TRINITY_DN4890_c0_g2_i1:366-1946(+)